MLLKDTPSGYGWISIALHWITFVVIVVLLYLGSSIGADPGPERQRMLVMHTSVAAVSYAALWARVIWRFLVGHPGPTAEQRGFAFHVGKWTHLGMLVVMAVLLTTGPLTAWLLGGGIAVFDWFVIPSPFGTHFEIGTTAHEIHSWMAATLFVAILLHIGGVYKHIAFNQDGTFMKILLPGKRNSDGPGS